MHEAGPWTQQVQEGQRGPEDMGLTHKTQKENHWIINSASCQVMDIQRRTENVLQHSPEEGKAGRSSPAADQQEDRIGRGIPWRMCACCMCSHVGLFANPWTVARQASLSMEFSRQ